MTAIDKLKELSVRDEMPQVLRRELLDIIVQIEKDMEKTRPPRRTWAGVPLPKRPVTMA